MMKPTVQASKKYIYSLSSRGDKMKEQKIVWSKSIKPEQKEYD
jgi:hypothetical protein